MSRANKNANRASAVAPGSEFGPLLDGRGGGATKIHPETLPKLARRVRSGGHLNWAAMGLNPWPEIIATEAVPNEL